MSSSTNSEILLATDFGELARRALAWAKTIARLRSASVRALHVLDLTEFGPPGRGESRLPSFTVARASAETALRAIRQELRLSGIESTATLISSGNPASALRQAVLDHPPSLLILGLNGARSRTATAPGATARALLAAPPCPILTVNRLCSQSPAPRETARIAIVVDHDAQNLRAALDVWPSSPGSPSPTRFAISSRDTGVDLPAAVPRSSTLVLGRKDAADTILRHLTEDRTGVLILAFSARGPLAALTRGSLKHTLLTRSPCPVLTLPPTR